MDAGIFPQIFFPPPIAFFVLQKGIEGGLEEIVVCGVVCIVYSILPLCVLLNMKQVLLLHVGKNVSFVVGGSATYLVTLDAQNMGIWFLAYNSTIF